MAKKRRRETTSPAAPGEDRISSLPDEVLHIILRGIKPAKQAAKTIAISRRWRTLWRSYPVAEFDEADCRRPRRHQKDTTAFAVAMADLEKFCDATIKRFSQPSNEFRIETLNVSLRVDAGGCGPPVLQQLVNLASKERKLEELFLKFVSSSSSSSIINSAYRKPLAIPGLWNYGPKLIKLTSCWIDFPNGTRRLPSTLTNSLRSLTLESVTIEDLLFNDLIARSQFLETLEIDVVYKLTNLHIFNPALKTLKIVNPESAREIHIAAPKLETLLLRGLNRRYASFKLLDEAPLNLEFLEFGGGCADHFKEVISKLPSLKRLVLHGDFDPKLKFATPPNLEEFKLVIGGLESRLEEIEVDAGPSLARFVLCCKDKYNIDGFTKCEIRNAPVAARPWEVDFSLLHDLTHSLYELLERVQSLVARLPEFQVVNLSFLKFSKITFDPKKVIAGTHPRVVSIEHLKLETKLSRKTDQVALLDGVFWACRPKFLTVVRKGLASKPFFKAPLGLVSRDVLCTDDKEQVGHPYNWQYRLKDAKIVMKNSDDPVTEEISEEMVPSLATEKRVCFRLTWL